MIHWRTDIENMPRETDGEFLIRMEKGALDVVRHDFDDEWRSLAADHGLGVWWNSMQITHWSEINAPEEG